MSSFFRGLGGSDDTGANADRIGRLRVLVIGNSGVPCLLTSMSSRITTWLAPWRHLAPSQCQKMGPFLRALTRRNARAPLRRSALHRPQTGLSEAISSCVQAAARRRWRTCWPRASRCRAQPPQSAATPSSRCCQHTAHNQLQSSCASNLRAVLALLRSSAWLQRSRLASSCQHPTRSELPPLNLE